MAKNVFVLPGALTGKLKFKKKLSRIQFRKFMTEHSEAVVVMEASGKPLIGPGKWPGSATR